MRRLLKEANDAGAAIKEETFITILLDSFPESWDPVVSILHGEKDLMVVIARLSAHGERLAGEERYLRALPVQRRQHPTKRYKLQLMRWRYKSRACRAARTMRGQVMGGHTQRTSIVKE